MQQLSPNHLKADFLLAVKQRAHARQLVSSFTPHSDDDDDLLEATPSSPPTHPNIHAREVKLRKRTPNYQPDDSTCQPIPENLMNTKLKNIVLYWNRVLSQGQPSDEDALYVVMQIEKQNTALYPHMTVSQFDELNTIQSMVDSAQSGQQFENDVVCNLINVCQRIKWWL